MRTRRNLTRAASRLAAAVLLACVAAETPAAVISPLSASPSGRRSDAAYTIGYDFTVGATNQTINALGIEDITNSGAAGYGDGLVTRHAVGIWNASGTLLASVNVAAGTQATLVNGFRYEPIAPLTLVAGQTYTIGATMGAGIEYFSDGGTAANYAAASGFTLSNARYAGGGTLTRPTSNGSTGGGVNGRWSGGNATFIANPALPVPSESMLLNSAHTGNRSDYTGAVGFEFTTANRTTTIEALGFYDSGQDGLATSHRVGIWDGSVELGQVVVQAGTASTLIGDFRYQTLWSSITLLANHTYQIVAEVINGGDAWLDTAVPSPGTFNFNPEFAGYSFGRGAYSASFSAPTNYSAGRLYVAPNLLIAVPAPAALPAGLSLLALMPSRRRRA